MQWEHYLLAAVVFMVLSGAKKIPEMMGGLGRGIREFKNAVKDIEKDISIK